MALKQISTRIPRHWGIVGFPDTGKSTFLAAMAKRILLVDADHRGSELSRHAGILTLGDDPAIHCDPYRIAQAVRADHQAIQQEGIQLFAIDSLTAIVEGSIALAMEGNTRGVNKNRAAAFSDKSNAIKLLQDAMAQVGTDTAVIWHLQDRRDNNARETIRQTLPDTERKSLKRSMNALLHLYKTPQGQRAVRVTWSRAHGDALKHLEIPDTEGRWRGVPEQLDRLLAEPAAKSAP